MWPIYLYTGTHINRKNKSVNGAGGMAQLLRVLAALAEDPGLIPKTHMVSHSEVYSSSRVSDFLF